MTCIYSVKKMNKITVSYNHSLPPPRPSPLPLPVQMKIKRRLQGGAHRKLSNTQLNTVGLSPAAWCCSSVRLSLFIYFVSDCLSLFLPFCVCFYLSLSICLYFCLSGSVSLWYFRCFFLLWGWSSCGSMFLCVCQVWFTRFSISTSECSWKSGCEFGLYHCDPACAQLHPRREVLLWSD